jgi:geranylgeranyl diphosphate synthase type II
VCSSDLEIIQKYLTDPDYPSQFAIPPRYRTDRDFHWQLVSEYPRRQGKYLRPTLLALTAESMGSKSPEIFRAAAAMQVSEDWILNHDDFEDNSTSRRGQPALHRMYSPELAVNAGDTLHIIMWKIIFDINIPALTEEFYRILTRTALGQTTEIAWTKNNQLDFTDDDWFFICDGKTSYYTIAGPIRLGAILANADANQLNLLTDFGINLGRCFQLVDDILDLTSDFRGLKPQIGNDIYEGKRTLILGHLLRSASPSDKKQITAVLAKSRDAKTPADVALIMELINSYGSLEYAKSLALKYKNQALEILNSRLDFIKSEPARSHLKTLTDFILERDY